MIGFLHSLFALISQVMRIFEKHQFDKQRQSSSDLQNKADVYEKLQKATAARDLVRDFNPPDNLMSDDGYQRK